MSRNGFILAHDINDSLIFEDDDVEVVTGDRPGAIGKAVGHIRGEVILETPDGAQWQVPDRSIRLYRRAGKSEILTQDSNGNSSFDLRIIG